MELSWPLDLAWGFKSKPSSWEDDDSWGIIRSQDSASRSHEPLMLSLAVVCDILSHTIALRRYSSFLSVTTNPARIDLNDYAQNMKTIREHKETARTLECDESGKAFDKALGKIGKAKPEPKKAPPRA